MGLDMYARRIRKDLIGDLVVDFDIPESRSEEFNRGSKEIAYWRKHPNLHGWMENLYREKGGTDPDFNCVEVVLDADDLDRLERAVNNHALPETSGFFFGRTDGTEVQQDLEFIAKAREAIAAGDAVFYTSWW